MKKLTYVFAAAAIVVAAASCEKVSDFVHGVKTNEQGLVDDRGKDLTPDQQKVKIEETANTMMELMDKSQWEADYQEVNSTMESLDKKEINSDNVSDYLKRITSLWESVRGEDPNQVAVLVAHLTDLKGHFTENAEGTFDIDENFDDLAITVYDGTVPVTVTFAARNEAKTPFHYEDKDDDVTIYIPGTSTLSVAKNNKVIGSLEVRLDPKDVNGDGIINQEDNINIGYTVKVGVYTFDLTQADYATDHASVKASIYNGKKLIIGTELSAAYEYSFENTPESTAFEVTKASANAMVDLAGKTQIRFNLPDGLRVEELSTQLNAQYQDGAAFKATLAEIEKLYGFGVYYDGKKTLQATLGFEAMSVNDEVAGEYWYANPVIRFADGTSYAVEEYFNEERFGNLANDIMSWIQDLQKYLGLDQENNK
jgi:hypothetical protein